VRSGRSTAIRASSTPRSHFERAVAVAERGLGPDHPVTATALDQLGMTLLAQGHADRAAELEERALRIYTGLLGPDHPRIAQELHNLGNAHLALSNDVLAQRELRRALAIREATLGPDHPDLATNLADLARALCHHGCDEDGLVVARRALAVGETAFGPEHPTLAQVLVVLGINLGKLGRFAEASDRLGRAEAIFTKLNGPDHVDVLRVAVARGDVLLQEARWRDAAALYERVIPRLESSEGADDVLGSSMVNLGRAYLELHAPGRALAPLERAAAKLDGLDPDERVELELGLARALWDTGGDRARAHELARHALADVRAIAGARHDDVVRIERWLASHPVG
jgi:tetratricopeptide (TPR) repeat protein